MSVQHVFYTLLVVSAAIGSSIILILQLLIKHVDLSSNKIKKKKEGQTEKRETEVMHEIIRRRRT